MNLTHLILFKFFAGATVTVSFPDLNPTADYRPASVRGLDSRPLSATTPDYRSVKVVTSEERPLYTKSGA